MVRVSVLMWGRLLRRGVVLNDIERFVNQDIVIRGEVVDVCVKRGCWMRISDAGTKESIFVKFYCPIKGRLIPLAAKGKVVYARGELVESKISEKLARHYYEDAGGE